MNIDDQAKREAIVAQAIRWCNNILVEVLSNHGEHVHEYTRDCLRDAVNALGEASTVAKEIKPDE